MTIKHGIETDINKRWEQGMDHHPEAIAAVKGMGDADFYLGGDSLCIKTGGDGDNGEHMAYLLSIYFEAKDKGLTIKDLLK